MNALIKKEIRLLLPGFALGMLALVANWHWDRVHYLEIQMGYGDIATRQFWFLFVPLLFLGLSAFGRELSAGTLSVILSVPASRARVWRVKTLTLALAIGLIVCPSCLLEYSLRYQTHETATNIWGTSALGALVMVSGALWTVLLFRQIWAALWITLLVPFGMIGAINLMLEHHRARSTEISVFAFVAYGVLGMIFARWLFFRAQDVQTWMGGDQICMPVPRWMAPPGISIRREKKPILALVKKELQLYHVLLVMALGLGLLHLGVLAVRTYYPFEANSGVKAVFEAVWWLWLIMPLLVGCTAISEERRLGTLPGQLCLPVNRRTQFIAKFAVATVLALVLGIGAPWLLEGNRIPPVCKLEWAEYALACNRSVATGFWGHLKLELIGGILAHFAWVPFVLVCLALVGIAFYASSFARNPLEALGLSAVGIVAAASLLDFVVCPEARLQLPLWRGPLIFLVGGPGVALVVLGLGYWNYQRVRVGWKDWRRNLFALGASLALLGAVTSFFYHRTWEMLLPLEPTPGVAKIPLSASSSVPTRIRVVTDGFNAVRCIIGLPDGRVWVNRYYSIRSGSLEWKLVGDPKFGGGRFQEGDHLKKAQASLGIGEMQQNRDEAASEEGSGQGEKLPEPIECKEAALGGSFSSRFEVGIFKDGTFREIASWRLDYKKRPARSQLVTVPENVQIGADHDWAGFIARRNGNPVLLKRNGTLWGINFSGAPHTRPGQTTYAAHQIGNRSDWVGGYSVLEGKADKFMALAADGSLWIWGFEPNGWWSFPGHPLLEQSRRPEYLGNIFAAQE